VLYNNKQFGLKGEPTLWHHAIGDLVDTNIDFGDLQESAPPFLWRFSVSQSCLLIEQLSLFCCKLLFNLSFLINFCECSL